MPDDVISMEIDLDTQRAEAKARAFARSAAEEFAKAWKGLQSTGPAGRDSTTNRNTNQPALSRVQRVQINTPLVQIIAKTVQVAGQTVSAGRVAESARVPSGGGRSPGNGSRGKGGGIGATSLADISAAIHSLTGFFTNPAGALVGLIGRIGSLGSASLTGLFGRRGGGASGGGAPSSSSQPASPTRALALSGTRALGSLMPYGASSLSSVGTAAAGAATSIGGAAAAIGVAVVALAAMTAVAKAAADALSGYNAALFAATTRLEMVTEGFKYFVAGRAGAQLAALQDAFSNLTAALAPVVSDLLNLVLPILTAFVNALTEAVLVFSVIRAAWKVSNPFTTGPDAVKNLKDALQQLTQGVSKLTDELAKSGNIAVGFLGGIMEHLHDPGVVAGGQQGRGGFRPVPNDRNLIPDRAPGYMPNPFPSGKSHLHQLLNLIPEGSPGAFPRPTPAALTFHTTDQININPDTDQRLWDMMQAMADDIRAKVMSMNDGRYRRALFMRHGVSNGRDF